LTQRGGVMVIALSQCERKVVKSINTNAPH